MPGEWPLVGREGELQRLRAQLAEPECRGVVLAGPAGVGKTRLAMEYLQVAEQAGCAGAWATATRAASRLPFGAVASLLPPSRHGEEGGVDDRADLIRRSVVALAERGGTRRLALVVDDAHLLDDASATLVHQLVQTNRAFILATVRTGELAPDPVTALWKDGLVERLELGGLRAQAIEEVLSSALDGPVDRATVAQLMVRCEGNVLFLRELVLGAVEDGTLRNDGGIWHLAGPFAPSERLIELVEARLDGLSPGERALLEVMSFGEPLGATQVVTVAGEPHVAESLERKALLVSRRDGRRLEVRLAHPIYGDVVRARIPAVRVPAIARTLAEMIEADGARRREDTLRVATWRLDGGGARPELMLAAATIARWRYDFPLAERLARAAVQVGAGFDAALLAAQMVSLQGRGEEAEEELAVLSTRATDDAQRALVALTRLDTAVFYRGQIGEGLRVAEEAEASIQSQAWRDELTARRSAVLLVTQGPRVAAAAAETLLQRATGRALAWACFTASYSLGRLGRLEAAVDASTLGHSAHLALAEPMDWYPWMHLYCRCEALTHAGRFEEAEALATEQYRQAVADGSAEAQGWFGYYLGKVVADRGNLETAARHLREAAALFRQLGRPQFVGWSLTYLILALALGGRAREAAETDAELDALGLPVDEISAVDLLQARAWTAVAAGDMPRAHRVLEESAAHAESIGDLVGEAATLHGLARLGRAKDVVPRLDVLESSVEGGLVAARAAHARALARGDPKELETVADRFEAMRAYLLAAEAVADAAVATRRRGDARAVAALERRLARLADCCEGAATPALAAIETRSRLTRAERETALLAANGRSSKEIADELCLSVRTVEGRLHRVYEKLGISGRAELASALEVPLA